jgi:hypothetical protein
MRQCAGDSRSAWAGWFCRRECEWHSPNHRWSRSRAGQTNQLNNSMWPQCRHWPLAIPIFQRGCFSVYEKKKSVTSLSSLIHSMAYARRSSKTASLPSMPGPISMNQASLDKVLRRSPTGYHPAGIFRHGQFGREGALLFSEIRPLVCIQTRRSSMVEPELSHAIDTS